MCFHIWIINIHKAKFPSEMTSGSSFTTVAVVTYVNNFFLIPKSCVLNEFNIVFKGFEQNLKSKMASPSIPDFMERKGSLFLRSDHMDYGRETLVSNW